MAQLSRYATLIVSDFIVSSGNILSRSIARLTAKIRSSSHQSDLFVLVSAWKTTPLPNPSEG